MIDSSFKTIFLILGIVTDHTLGREVVTVNVNQINEDLIRQVGAVSNTVNPPASHSYLQGDIYFLYGHVYKRNYVFCRPQLFTDFNERRYLRNLLQCNVKCVGIRTLISCSHSCTSYRSTAPSLALE